MRLDPRTKLLILAVTSVSVFMNKSIAVECVLAGIPLVLLSTSGNLKRMLKYAAFFLTLLLIQLFIVPRLPVTFGGIVYMFAVYIRKLLPCFMLGSFLIATTGVLSDANSIACLHLHVIGANRAIFSAFFCAIHYDRRGWRLFCCGETGNFTAGKTISVVNYEAATANGYLFPDF